MVGLWVDVFNAAGVRQGSGPVSLIRQIEVNRQLDGAGTFSINAAVDAQAISLLTNEQRVKIYTEDALGVRLVGQGIIEDHNVLETATGINLRVTGPDILDELVRKNTLRALIFNQATVQTVADTLIALVSGWSVSVDAAIASDVVDARYDGSSILKAFRDLVKRYGYHFRLSSDDKVVTVSQFGDDSGLRVFKVERITPAMIRDPNLLFVKRLPQKTDSKDLANWIEPLGAGEGVAALTLAKSTRTRPYSVQKIDGPGGKSEYYISDAASVATYGQIEVMKTFKQIAPLSNSETDIINAADALYDATVEWLTRHKDPVVRYALPAVNAKENILPGDKIHLNYKGQIKTPQGEIVDYLSVRGDFWVMSAVETINLQGRSVSMEIASIDERENTVAEQVADSMENITLRTLKPLTGVSKAPYQDEIEIDSTHVAVLFVDLTNSTLSLQRVRYKLKTFSFRATSKAGAAGGGTTETSTSGTGHNHLVAPKSASGASSNQETPYSVQSQELGGPPGTSWLIWVGTLSSQTQADIWTTVDTGTHDHDLTLGDHVHDAVFGITDDSLTPVEVTVFVNGVDKTTELFGFTPLAPAGGNLDVIADVGVMTDLFINAAGGLRQEHEIEVHCASGQGRAKMVAEVYEVLQSIDLG